MKLCISVVCYIVLFCRMKEVNTIRLTNDTSLNVRLRVPKLVPRESPERERIIFLVPPSHHYTKFSCKGKSGHYEEHKRQHQVVNPFELAAISFNCIIFQKLIHLWMYFMPKSPVINHKIGFLIRLKQIITPERELMLLTNTHIPSGCILHSSSTSRLT